VYGVMRGYGGNYYGGGTPTVATGGEGQGGTATIQLGGGTAKIGGSLSFYVDGYAGYGHDGGQGFGGNAGVYGAGGSADLGPSINLSATATGGSANSGYGGAGGGGQGGAAFIAGDPATRRPPGPGTVPGGWGARMAGGA